jgi:hypoxanthine-guanine phosphoribosyltransferase
MKDKITISRAELASAASKASAQISEQMMKKSNRPEISLVSNLFGAMFTAQLIRELFDETGSDS